MTLASFALTDWELAGLNVPSGVKAQLTTVESALILKIIGQLSAGGSSCK